jgi:hypothetical protein
MSWELNGTLVEACSCESACPCVLGPAKPDQGWCSGALTFVIDSGNADGVDLSGRKVLFLIDLPADFAGGDGTVRLHIDDGATAEQTGKLEDIFQGRAGGPGAVLGSLVSTWLPTKKTSISLEGSDDLSLKVGDVGSVAFVPIKNSNGQPTAVMNAPVLGLIEISKAELARGDGSSFADPDMREWSSLGHASRSPFKWAA